MSFSKKGSDALENELHLKGRVKYVKWRSGDDAVHIMSLETEKGEITIIGSLYGVSKGEEIEVWGTKEIHPKFGDQLKVSRWEKPLPNSKEKVEEFLSSNLIKGVGKKTAKRVVEKFGEDAINEILERGPEALHGIKGITKKNAKKVYNSLHETFEIQRIVMQLSDMGLSPALSIRAYQHYGSSVAEMVKRNPYCLTNVNLIGFQKADEIARKLEIPPDSPFRINSAIKYVLEQAAVEGHCFLSIDDAAKSAMEILNHKNDNVHYLQVKNLIGNDYKNTVVENNDIYLKRLYKAEREVANKVHVLSSKSSMRIPHKKIDKKIKHYEIKNNIILAEEQKSAVKKIIENNILILTGGPGTGKSTTVNAVIDCFEDLNHKADIYLAAPTGKASRRLAEITGRETYTIHRMLGIKPGSAPDYNPENTLPADLIVIDEFSMVDISLATILFSAIRHDTKVLIVGDCDQLPSVGPGNVLKSLIKANLPSVQLNKIFRQAEKSQIVTNAHRINTGNKIQINTDKGDFYFIRRENPEDIQRMIVASYIRLIQLGYKIEDIQVLSPMKDGPIGTIEFNRILQDVLNPASPDKSYLQRGQTVFRVGSKVIQQKNNYHKDIYNGEVGIISSVYDEKDENERSTGEQGLIIDFNGYKINYKKNELNQLQLAFSITIHKSQGAEWPIILMPVAIQHYRMLARNLLYTGTTRAKKIVVLVGTDKALNIAIQNNKITHRNTRLGGRILLGRNEKYLAGTV